MPYSVLPDRRIPYDNDGTVVGRWRSTAGIMDWYSAATLIEMNDFDMTLVGYISQYGGSVGGCLFFPEQREVTAFYALTSDSASDDKKPVTAVLGSDDTTNGLDGTWETATLSGGVPTYANDYSWRDGIKPISFTGGKRVVVAYRTQPFATGAWNVFHLYGEKAAGQTPDDLIFIDHDTTPGVEYTAPEDFGDRPLGTSVTRQFRVKNASSTLTANTINLQCNDTDFVISEDGTTWVVTINIASLAAGAESSTLYIRNTTPDPGGLLGPRFARIIATVGSWT